MGPHDFAAIVKALLTYGLRIFVVSLVALVCVAVFRKSKWVWVFPLLALALIAVPPLRIFLGFLATKPSLDRNIKANEEWIRAKAIFPTFCSANRKVEILSTDEKLGGEVFLINDDDLSPWSTGRTELQRSVLFEGSPFVGAIEKRHVNNWAPGSCGIGSADPLRCTPRKWGYDTYTTNTGHGIPKESLRPPTLPTTLIQVSPANATATPQLFTLSIVLKKDDKVLARSSISRLGKDQWIYCPSIADVVREMALGAKGDAIADD